MNLAIDIIGWIGAILILGAYGLLSSGRLTSNSRLFQWMNIVGAVGFIINSGWKEAYPSAALNVAWVGIGLATLWRMRNPKPLP